MQSLIDGNRGRDVNSSSETDRNDRSCTAAAADLEEVDAIRSSSRHGRDAGLLIDVNSTRLHQRYAALSGGKLCSFLGGNGLVVRKKPKVRHGGIIVRGQGILGTSDRELVK